VNAAEYRAALHAHDGDFHHDIESVLKNWVEQKLLDARISVEIVYQ
jgi:hypothetical protein